MRYIDTTEFRPTPEWLLEAKQATDALRDAANAEERKKLLSTKRYQSLWTEQKLNLSKISHGKCWYCESREVRDDNAVDHFRPKGNVQDAPGHGGYWWLAFDWENYRYTCTYCNSIRKSVTTSGGKQDFFPIEDEKMRATVESADHEDELPILLDPTKILDFWILGFSEDGSVEPAVMAAEDPLNYKRAMKSIERYHLRHPLLVQQRIKRLEEVRRLVKEADKAQKRYAEKREPAARENAENRIREIRRKLLPEEEHSMAVRYLLGGMVSSLSARTALRAQ